MAGAAWPYRAPTPSATHGLTAPPAPPSAPHPPSATPTVRAAPLLRAISAPPKREARGESEGSPRGVRGGPSHCGWLEESASSVVPA